MEPSPADTGLLQAKKNSDALLILRGADVASILEERDEEIVALLVEVYKMHAMGRTSLPHSVFLSLPSADNRIIALPACLDGDKPVAGIKWISSFPRNVVQGMDRASGVIVVNDVNTGRPTALLEGSLISTRRTAASAMVAARILESNPKQIALVGCGTINFEIARLASKIFPELNEVIVFDVCSERPALFALRLRRIEQVRSVRIAQTVEEACSSCRLISIATTALQPHIHDSHMFQSGSVILHISLRDLSPQLMLSFDNIVDDPDHVCRANTSLQMCERLTGNRQFIRTSLGDILLNRMTARRDPDTPVIFSPFGLGILDLAVAQFATNVAAQAGIGTSIARFFPESWRS